jgi:biotin operon repressor
VSGVAQLVLPEVERATPGLPNDHDQRLVLDVLRDGRRHTREQLVDATGLVDRAVRAAIEQLRRGGQPIVSASDRSGYALSWQPEELDALERDLSSRALAALRTRSAIRRARRQRDM